MTMPPSNSALAPDDASTPEHAIGERSASYWKTVDGHAYELLVRKRQGNGSARYDQQERFMARFVAAEQARRGRVLDVLEFGCGYGRHARYLSALDGVRYHGYDFSEGMTGPLRSSPPPGVQPVAERLFVGSDVASCVGERRFDLVFTVSVLIHNPPERAAAVIRQMGSLLASDGTICLVENQLVPVSVFENMWHEGCWLHCIPEMVEDGWELHLGHGLVEEHGVYVLRRHGGEGRRYFRLALPGTTNAAEVPLSPADLDALSMPRMKAWATSTQHALQTAAGAQQVRVADLEERVEAQRLQAERHRSLGAIPDVLAALRAKAKKDSSAEHESEPEPERAPPPAVLWNAPLDTRWAQADESLARVVHVFHQEWQGIRASAGYTPGQKLAIVGERPIAAPDLRRALELVVGSGAKVVVFHGYSDNADALAVLLRGTLGRGVRLYAAWLGTTAQFHLDCERMAFGRIMRRLADRTFEGVACVKPGLHAISERLFQKPLLSMPPRVENGPPAIRQGLSGEVFIPVPNDWRKNFFTNLHAAGATPRVRVVHASASFSPVPGARSVNVVRWKRPERAQVFHLMRACDVVLNATLSECQPMTALEGLAIGTPCLTGALGLGVPLETHAFAQLTHLAAVDSVEAVRDGIERVLDLRDRSPRELGEMMADYARLVYRAALDRYAEFLRP